MTPRKLKSILEKIYSEFHSPHYLTLDPLCWVRQFSNPLESEAAGLIASSLAYGRVEQIIKSLNLLSSISGNAFLKFVHESSYAEKRKTLKEIKHRFNTGEDIALLLETMKTIQTRFGSIGALATQCYSQHADMFGVMNSFGEEFLASATRISPALPESFKFLLPTPAAGSACKRLNMYFRWMIRSDDGIDLGIWKYCSTQHLVIPVDSHVLRLAREFGMTKRTVADWKSALEITAVLRMCDPVDPVRYDFSLCRFGMVNFRKGDVRG